MIADFENAEVDRRRPIRPTDLYRLRSVGEVALHPDRRTVVFTVLSLDAEIDRNRSHLYSVALDGTALTALTTGPSDSLIRFSPNGELLAFVRSGPDRPTEIIVRSWPVGEERQVLTVEDGKPSGLEWVDDHRLVVLAPQRPAHQEGVDADELARRPKILTKIDYRFNGRGAIHDRPRQVWTVDVDAEVGAVPIGSVGIDHSAVAVSPDGQFVAATAATDQDRDLSGSNHVWLYPIDPATGPPTRLTEPGGEWLAVGWHPDNTLLVTGIIDNSAVGFARVHTVDGVGDSGAASVAQLTAHDGNLGRAIFRGRNLVAVDGGVLAPGVRRGRVAVDRYDFVDRSHTVVFEDDCQVSALDASPDGSVMVAAVTGPSWPAELWRIDDGTPTRLVGLNDDVLAELDLAQVETVSVPSTDDVEVEAWITRPPASAPAAGIDGRAGLIYVHGGPMFQYGHHFFDEFQMAAACGYVVIGGNPRGSDGYGEAWATSIAGDLGNRDHHDVLALARHLADMPEVDADRIGIGGGSYGGFMAAWVLGHRSGEYPRFRAGLIERAVTSWTTMYGTSDIGNWFTSNVVGATIEDDPDEVIRQSPVTYAANIAAPVLILHSEEDWRCPIEQAEQLFAAIRRTGGNATFVRFPGENHELSRSGRPRHRVERFEIIHEFFAEHLGGSDFGSSHLTRSPR